MVDILRRLYFLVLDCLMGSYLSGPQMTCFFWGCGLLEMEVTCLPNLKIYFGMFVSPVIF